MTPRFRLTEPAIQDIEQIADYIATQSGLAQSEIFLSKLDAKFAKIAQFPGLGRQRDEILPGIRSLSIDNYLILYMAIGQDVEIFRVVSGYRDIKALFHDSDS
ncbi:plasmid stabilization protein [Nostoc linckia z18]|uniref:Plasmid stabilization protein n=2 Tax=Nostoc linckia TaxID=92942 RepID=A0A9Q6EHQ3_NOSLI|nr:MULTISPECIES: type II toxin-antitoxin system RelE/ParE family toxin [Nostoc]PHK37951.1 plasmid stabilization protein [Nostoc linckia z15]PHK42727.1 plasmid stabilization protein [Nostoc linckia z16]MBC1237455.1 type II toxin-antitoxin system RelE/ParE family toxin [Nostoc sp. 2RC]PHJ57865.1 plasmid stabilization protein [Nostoc linckia z1]PHJ60515.1 plasmid stabilization protein [Nostoc linckia z3]